MRMLKKFSRWVGTPPAGRKAFGDDPSPPSGRPDANADNYFSIPAHSNQGYPVKSLLVLWASNPGILSSGDTLFFAVWLWDSLTETWCVVTAQQSVTLVANTITTSPLQAPQDPIPNRANIDRPTGGTLEGYVVFEGVASGGDYANGEYVICLAPNMND